MAEQHLIVGGTSGIGAALLDLLVERGHTVTQLSRHPENAPSHPRVTSLCWDARRDLFPAERLPETLHGLTYCPGTIRLKPFERISEREWLEDLELNLMGAVRAIQGSLKALRRAESASVVLFSTVAVGTGMPFHASVASAKGAVEGLARALAAELAPRIRVNVLAPTLTATPLADRLLSSPEKRAAVAERHPLKRIAEPADLARAALWLLEDAPLTTGQVIHVDGGLSTLRLNT
ncbi:MAG: SDR family NAD(P)-dependent oxidoreductase [Bdellovibrio bacteriovorus]